MSSQLEALRAQVREKKPKPGRKKVWHEPEEDDFAQGWVLAFDQTLTKTGWVILANNRLDHTGIGEWLSPGLHIRAGGVLRPGTPSSLRSFEQTFAKAESMGLAIERVVGQYRWVNVVVHEMPSVMGHRIESSLMAAREIRRACGGHRVEMVSRQAAYATLTGHGSGEKRLMTEAVNRLIPDYNRVTERWTQDVHDAVGLALKYLYDEKQGNHG